MISLILTLAVVGLVVWLLVTYVPMPDPIKKLIVVVAILLIVLYLLQVFGFDIPLPAARHH